MILKKVTPTGSFGHSNKKLLLFFTGWGMDENPFREYQIPDCDFMIVYDYSSLSFDDTFLKPYDEIRVVAWSMGVWAASQLLQDRNYPVTDRIAVNGTHFPVDDRKGIPSRIFAGTLNNLNESTLSKFRKRMCGSGDVLERFLAKAPERDIENLRTELDSIGRLSLSLAPSRFKWSKVYIGNGDKIFPVENQMKAWEETDFILTDEEHYPEKLWEEIFNKKNNNHKHE